MSETTRKMSEISKTVKSVLLLCNTTNTPDTKKNSAKILEYSAEDWPALDDCFIREYQSILFEMQTLLKWSLTIHLAWALRESMRMHIKPV